MNKANTIQEVVDYTNQRIKGWYQSAAEQGLCKGAGTCHYNKANNEIVVEYTEDGVQATWRMAFYEEYLADNDINWVYHCWMELA